MLLPSSDWFWEYVSFVVVVVVCISLGGLFAFCCWLFFVAVVSWNMLFWNEFACAFCIVIIAVWILFSKLRLGIFIWDAIMVFVTLKNVPWMSFSVELTSFEIAFWSVLFFSSTVTSSFELCPYEINLISLVESVDMVLKHCSSYRWRSIFVCKCSNTFDACTVADFFTV